MVKTWKSFCKLIRKDFMSNSIESKDQTKPKKATKSVEIIIG